MGSYHHIFDETFGEGKDLEKFWSGVEQSGDDKLTGHPMCLEKHWKEKTIPLFIHGDGVAFQNRDTILVFSWGSLLGDKGSLEKHFLLANYPKSCTNEKTWPPLWKWLKWSFESLGKKHSQFRVWHFFSPSRLQGGITFEAWGLFLCAPSDQANPS